MRWVPLDFELSVTWFSMISREIMREKIKFDEVFYDKISASRRCPGDASRSISGRMEGVSGCMKGVLGCMKGVLELHADAKW